MPSFASVSELETHLQRSFAPAEIGPAEQALDLASGLIQSYTGMELFPGTTSQTWRRPANFSRLGGSLVLRQRPVTVVTEVVIDGDVVDPADYTVAGPTGILSVSPSAPLSQTLPDWPAVVTVEYGYGFDPVPGFVKAVCLEVARQSFDNPQGFVQMSAGPFSATYGSNRDAPVGLVLTARHERTLARL